MIDEIIRIVIAILSGIVGTGTFLRFFFERKLDAKIQGSLHKEKLLIEEELEFRKLQLKEFYGPIYASLKLTASIRPLWYAGNFPEVNSNIINLFTKQNEEIMSILKTKAHLIEGKSYPPDFSRYMISTTIWGMYCSRTNERWLPPKVESIEEIKFPEEFADYIYNTTEELKAKYNDLLRKHKLS